MSVVWMTKIIEGTRNGNLSFEVNPERHSNRIEPGDDTTTIVKMLFAWNVGDSQSSVFRRKGVWGDYDTKFFIQIDNDVSTSIKIFIEI